MAKIPHEALHHIFREDAGLFTRTLRRVIAENFPEVEAVGLVNGDLTEIDALERRVDTILRAETAEGPRLLVIEPQTEVSEKKVRSWAYYLSCLENKYEIPATLLVITPKEETARWARGPLTLGPPGCPSLRLFPFVVGPDNTPFITDPETAAEDVVFCVLAVLCHRLDPDIEKAMRPLAEALDSLDPETAAYWAEFTEGGLGKGCARESWRNIMRTMPYRYKSALRLEGEATGRAEGRVEGRVEGLAEAILAFLSERGVDVGDADRDRITACTDPGLLRRWLLRAPSVESAADLFAED
ncbi:hypothetical protein [Glycomyces xiaoerkulensis]|uniref:hypothetical protein n=1 Tax=Glycomyces xiaoerkulensis TaxID=2038139 RepID=UPI000C259075|nr:hypothetical protein [Glycomyces xiaoerkulensis]